MKFINIFKRKKNKQKMTKQQDIDLLSAGYYTNNPPPLSGQIITPPLSEHTIPPLSEQAVNPPTSERAIPPHFPELTNNPPMRTAGIALPPPHIYHEETDSLPIRKNNSAFFNKNIAFNKPDDFISPIPPHSNGKEVCKKARQIRQEYAKNLGIEITFEECTYEGPCSGTCPKCEQELEIINNAISKRKDEEQL